MKEELVKVVVSTMERLALASLLACEETEAALLLKETHESAPI